MPRYWGTWLALGVLRCLVFLPYGMQMQLGRGIGALLGSVPSSFRRVAERNLELCLPAVSSADREQLLRSHWRSLGMSLFETGITWWWADARILKLTQVEGLEHLDAALAEGKGAILLSAHFTTLEIGARAICARRPTSIMYRPTRNAVLERFLQKNRGRHAKRAIPRDDIRALIAALKSNETVWYAPDQSYRKKGAHMVAFFGVPAATNTATSRLAKLTGAAVLPYFPQRLSNDSGYRMVIHPALDNFPSDDPVADAERFNRYIEAQVRMIPEQYLWIHRRFKGLSDDYADYYGKGEKG